MSVANPPEPISAVKMACERILKDRFSNKIHLALDHEVSGTPQSNVQRFQVLDAPSDFPSKLIAKQVVISDNDATDHLETEHFGSVQRFFNEWAALQFLEKIFGNDSPAPKFYGGDLSLGLILMEDLSNGDTLITPLSGNDPVAAEVALIEHMEMLGRLHAGTVGTQETYNHFRHGLGPTAAYFSPAAEDLFPPDKLVSAFHTTLQMLAIDPPPGLKADLAAVVSFWANPGPFLVYTHGDPAPGNEFTAGTQRKLIDFEYGGFRHALTEGVYARMQFVTGAYVLRIPEAVTHKMEDAYRAELVKGCPAAADDLQFYQAVMEACAYVTIATWHWAFPKILSEDEEWGVSSGRQRLLRRLDILAQTAATVGHLEAMGTVAQAVATKLRSLWPVEVDSMLYYPAFR